MTTIIDSIVAAIEELKQQSPTRENGIAMERLEGALMWLQK